MKDQIFVVLNQLDDTLWDLGVLALFLSGIYFTIKTNLFQVRKFPKIIKLFLGFIGQDKNETQRGTHPLKVFFASIGGAIGIGNVVVVCTAVQVGGPGAVFWVWVASIFGMLIKYSEIYLGILTRKKNDEGGYDGGPMYYLEKAFSTRWVPIIICLLLCIYSVEILMFNVITDSFAHNWQLNKYLVMGVLLTLILLAGIGGIKRIGNICSAIIPLFLTLFGLMSCWVLIQNAAELPIVLKTIFTSAFSQHAPVGGFVGASLMLTMQQGIARGCYSGDIGVGFASVLHSESTVEDPRKQAALGIFGIFLDTIIVCTFSLLLILITGVWKDPMPPEMLVQEALGRYFPYMHIFMPTFIFMLGYSTLIALFVIGAKCAKFLWPRWGQIAFYIYASLSFILFSFLENSHALTIMSLSGASLLLINLLGIFKLRKEIKFGLD